MTPAVLAVAGLGTMGRNLALNVAEHGFPVTVWNRRSEAAQALERDAGDLPLRAATSLEQVVASLERPRKVLLMVPAGAPVDEMIARLAPLLERGDVLVDGGNSHWQHTRRRHDALARQGLRFVGLGVSGGEEGARHGPSLMPGGDPGALEAILPVLQAIAATGSDGPCVSAIGPGASGHFVKMVHNGIEYADMQLLAEAYDLLRKAGGLDAGACAEVFATWHAGPLDSFLTEITVAVLRRRDARTGRPLVDLVLDRAGQKGTGAWTSEAALAFGVPAPSIVAAVDARNLSADAALRQLAGQRLEGARPPTPPDAAPDTAALGRALALARLLAYAQGFHLLAAASREEGWDLSLPEVARIWTGGCIIRARLLEDVRAAFAAEPALPHLLLAPQVRPLLQEGQAPLREALASAARHAIAVPVLGASLAYLDTLTSAALPQNLTQAQRDAFGSHGYRRADAPDGPPEHTDWLGLHGPS